MPAADFGENWKAFLGECSKETAFEMLDYFWEQGGNFIDTANNCMFTHPAYALTRRT
jgi:aryl-alcohol dehydrogenase-like predicted oxidoreductase